MPKAVSVVFLTVDTTGRLETVQPIRAYPDSTVIFVMSNEHGTDDFKVEIKDFKRKETMSAALPLAGGPSHYRNLTPGEIDDVKIKTLPRGSFGGAGLPFTTYKYTVEVTNLTAGTAPVPIDPELDVCPP